MHGARSGARKQHEGSEGRGRSRREGHDLTSPAVWTLPLPLNDQDREGRKGLERPWRDLSEGS